MSSPSIARPKAATSFFPRHVAILVLVGVGLSFAGNHVGARVAFDNGAGLLLAVLCRSGFAFLAMAGFIAWRGRSVALPPGTAGWQFVVGLLIAMQSLGLYTGVANIPVALALLMHNTFPIMLVLITWAFGGPRPTLKAALIMAFILSGLILAFDVPSMLGGEAEVTGNWLLGVAGSIVSAAGLAGAVWISEHKLSTIQGAVRSMYTLAIVFLTMAVAGAAALVPGGMALPEGPDGWWGLLALIVLYGIGFSVLFICVPRLDMPRNAPVMNLEPVATFVFAWFILGQAIGPAQLLGGAIVLAGITLLALSRDKMDAEKP